MQRSVRRRLLRPRNALEWSARTEAAQRGSFRKQAAVTAGPQDLHAPDEAPQAFWRNALRQTIRFMLFVQSLFHRSPVVAVGGSCPAKGTFLMSSATGRELGVSNVNPAWSQDVDPDSLPSDCNVPDTLKLLP